MGIKNILINILSPPRCVFCMSPLSIKSTVCVCHGCMETLPYNNGKRCRICAAPLDIQYGDLYCHYCKRHKRAYAQNISRYIYKDKAAGAIKHMKFGKGQLWIADTLGKLLAETIKEEYADILFDLALYVPISKKGLRERGFNKSQIIAEAVCKELGIEKPEDVLVKISETPKQSGLELAKRRKNVKGAFEVTDDNKIMDKTILLIDDVHTTGATVHECAKTLRKAGAAVVFCATVASTSLNK